MTTLRICCCNPANSSWMRKKGTTSTVIPFSSFVNLIPNASSWTTVCHVTPSSKRLIRWSSASFVRMLIVNHAPKKQELSMMIPRWMSRLIWADQLRVTLLTKVVHEVRYVRFVTANSTSTKFCVILSKLSMRKTWHLTTLNANQTKWSKI